VSLELPGWVADAFNLIGLPWPGIDEDQLRGWASDLREYATEIASLSSRSRSAVAAAAAHDESAFGSTLASKWDHYHGVISGLRSPLEVFAGALDVAADAVVAQKIVVIGATVALAGEVIATQGEALLTFGLAEAEVPAEVAATQLIVRAALQELEGQLLGVLINKGAAAVSDVLGGAIGRLVTGGGQVAAEAVALQADYSALQTLSSALTGRRAQVEQASSVSWRRSTSRQLDTGGPGGGWREVARAVEEAVLRVLATAFKDLGRTIATIVQDTASFLRKAITDLRHTDTELAAQAEREATATLTAAHSIGAGGDPRPSGVPLPGQTGGSIRPRFDGSARAWERSEAWAADAYGAIRSSDDVAVIADHLSSAPRLDGGTGFTQEEVQTIKNQVFFEEHPLEGEDGGTVMSRFDPNANMAEAWLRLRSGNYLPPDLLLLEHELAEHNFWQQHHDAIFWEAHAAANEVANWDDNRADPTYEDYNKPWK
jgi:hypothetical protein